ncbi:MAG: DUF4113 domain-containing protein [Lysobacter sp.]
MSVFLHSDSFRPELQHHHPSRAVSLSADTTIILRCVRQLSEGMTRQGIVYKKAGIAWLDLARPEALQQDLFTRVAIGNDRLMSALDAINSKYGRGTARLGASGWQAKPQWRMRQLELHHVHPRTPPGTVLTSPLHGATGEFPCAAFLPLETLEVSRKKRLR